MKNLLAELKNVIRNIAQFLSKNHLAAEVLFIFFLSLIPLLWFRPGEYVLGHDANYPVDAINWLSSHITTWSERFNFGHDQSLILGRIIIFAFEALPQFLGASIYTSQKIIFVISFFLPGLSMYALSHYLLGPSKKYTLFRIFSSVFYMINLYMLQAWFIAEITKFSILTALPLVVMLTLKAFDKKTSMLTSILLSNLILFIFNGGGAAFTLYGGLFLILIGISASYLITGKFPLLKMAGYWTIFSILFLILNSYWLVPLIFYTSSNFNNAISTFGGIENTVRWTDALSKHTSIGNLLRLQGIPDWYDVPTHPYSNTFLTSPFFIAVSYAIPVFAALGLLLFFRKKGMRVHLLWIVISILLGIIFSAGTHEPFTAFYTFLLEKVPFFSTFRSAFYKFGYSLWFTYSILIGLAVNYIGGIKLVNLSFNSRLIQKVGEVKLGWKFLMFIFFLGIIFVYNFPLFTGSFFYWRENYSTKLRLPEYVLDYQEWAKEQPNSTRIMVLPALPEENQIDSYTWGYYSLDPLPTLLSDRTIILNNFEIGADKNNKEFVDILYDSVKSSPETFDQLAARHGINTLLLRKDVVYQLEGYETDSPADIENLLAQTSFKQAETFGEWIVFQNQNERELVEVVASPVEVQYSETTNLEIIKTILKEIGNRNFVKSNDGPIEGSDKLIFLDTANLASIDSKDNSFTYEFDYALNSPEIVISPLSISSASYNLSIQRIGGKLILDFSTPAVAIEYAGGKKIVPSETFSKELNVNAEGKNIGVILNGQIFKAGVVGNGQTMKLGSIQFPSGEDSIDISVFEENEGQELLQLDFEDDNIRDKTGSCGGESQNTSSQVIQSSNSEGKYLELSAKSAVSCLRLPIDLAGEKAVYKLSFNYLLLSGSSPSFCVLQQNDTASSCIPDTTINDAQKGKWENFEAVFGTEADIKKLVLHFYAKSDSEETVVSYDDIKLTRITDLGSESVGAGDLASLSSEEKRVKLDGFGGSKLRISSDISDGENILQDGSFENGLWGGASVCGADGEKEPDVFASFSEDRTDGERSLKLESNSGTACIRNKIEDFSKNAVYRISFDYKNLKGNAPRFCLLQAGSKKECLPLEEFDKSSKWHNYSAFVIPEDDASGLILHLYSDKGSSNLFDNVRMEKVERPFGIGYLKETNEQGQSASVQTSVTRVSSTKYKVRVNSLDESFVLSLDQAYNPGWKAYISSGNSKYPEFLDFLFDKQVPEKDHFAIDGVRNGWLIENAGAGVEITIEYFPQKVFEASGLVALVSFAIIFTIGSVLFVKNNYKDLKKKIWQEEGKIKELARKFDTIVPEP